jgi:hypothetical protein
MEVSGGTEMSDKVMYFCMHCQAAEIFCVIFVADGATSLSPEFTCEVRYRKEVVILSKPSF